MLIKKPEEIKSSEITPEKDYLGRRRFLQGALLAGTAASTALIYRRLTAPWRQSSAPAETAQVVTPGAAPRQGLPGEDLTPLHDITHYNNFYEFSTNKAGVADKAKGFVTNPWSVTVEGLVHKPRIYDLDDLARLQPPEERIYRLRCVEAWSMVIPWLGFPLAKLLEQAEPMAQAKYVQFFTLYAPDRMPLQNSDVLDWPYTEGLRLDEAMHPLTLLATGLYGAPLPPQNGAPLRLVVPWKYGFKSIKSIVRIRLLDQQPPTTWGLAAPDEYGFYSNVNPAVDHPRWSQARERRIGEFGQRATLLFNGYAEQVAQLYTGMDLKRNF